MDLKLDEGIGFANFASNLPNYWSRIFEFPDTTEDADNSLGNWGSRIGIIIIEVIAWLATKGNFPGISGDLKFPQSGVSNGNKYGQSRLPRDIIRSFTEKDSLTSQVFLIGLNSLYYNFVPGTFKILYGL